MDNARRKRGGWPRSRSRAAAELARRAPYDATSLAKPSLVCCSRDPRKHAGVVAYDGVG